MPVRTLPLTLLACAILATAQKELRVGTLGDEPAKKIRRLSPLVQLLARECADLGYGAGRVVVVPRAETMARLIRQRRVDLFIDSAFPTLLVQHLAGTRLLLRRWKKRIPEYYGLLLVRREAPIHALEDLNGRLVAFEDPYSTSAYFFARVGLHRAGLLLVRRSKPREPVPRNRVGYVFSRDEETSLVWLLRGQVAAAALSDGDVRELARERRQELRVLARFGPIPRHVVSVRRDLPFPVVARLQEVLTKLHETEAGRRALKAASNTERFDELTPANLGCLRRARIALREILRLTRAAGHGDER